MDKQAHASVFGSVKSWTLSDEVKYYINAMKETEQKYYVCLISIILRDISLHHQENIIYVCLPEEVRLLIRHCFSDFFLSLHSSLLIFKL